MAAGTGYVRRSKRRKTPGRAQGLGGLGWRRARRKQRIKSPLVAPSRRIAGRTWLRTHFWKSLACGLRERSTREYRPGSLTHRETGRPWRPVFKSVEPTKLVATSSGSSCSRSPLVLSPRASQTSLATNQGVPSVTRVDRPASRPLGDFNVRYGLHSSLVIGDRHSLCRYYLNRIPCGIDG